MRDGGIVVDYQSNGLAISGLDDVPFRLICLIFLLRKEEKRLVIIAPERLLVQPPFEVACCIHMLVDDDFEGLSGIRLGCDDIVRSREGQIIIVAFAVVGVGPWLSGRLLGSVGLFVVELGQCLRLTG